MGAFRRQVLIAVTVHYCRCADGAAVSRVTPGNRIVGRHARLIWGRLRLTPRIGKQIHANAIDLNSSVPPSLVLPMEDFNAAGHHD